MLHCPLLYGCMDYEQYLINSYSIPSAQISVDDFIFFYSDGTYTIESDTGYSDLNQTIESTQYFGANYYNRFLVQDHTNLVSFAYCFTNRDLLFCNTNRLEYAVYGSSNAVGNLYGYQNLQGDTIDDLSAIDNYWHANGHNPFSDFEDEGTLYGQYNISLTGGYPYAVFDYLNLKYDNLNDGITVIRGENMSFYNVVNELMYTSTPDYYYFSYGAPTLERYNQGWYDGHSDGYAQGWVNGNDNGYQVGINSQGGQVQQQPATAFTYIEGAFNVVGSVMSLEVLPNITLGLVWSIPLVFILIMTIFRLVRK